MVDEFVLGLSAGHGGDDMGTLAGAEHGISEHTYCADFVTDLENLIGKANFALLRDNRLQIKPVRLNWPGQTMSPRERGLVAANKQCDCVLSIHVNALPGSVASGLHAFYLPDAKSAQPIAEAIARAAPTPLRRRHLYATKHGALYIAGACEPALVKLGWPRPAALIGAYKAIPTVLVELFYASNPTDCAAALDPTVRLGLLSAVLAGVAEGARLLTPRTCLF